MTSMRTKLPFLLGGSPECTQSRKLIQQKGRLFFFLSSSCSKIRLDPFSHEFSRLYTKLRCSYVKPVERRDLKI